MNLKEEIFSIWDRKAETYNTPFVMTNEAVAIRQFKSLINNPDTMPGKYPDDYILFRIGYFDSESGIISKIDKPDLLCEGVKLTKKEDI